jgi:hypothetical protein
MTDVFDHVARAFIARAYPWRRPDGVWAPEGVGPRVKPGDDERGRG